MPAWGRTTCSVHTESRTACCTLCFACGLWRHKPRIQFVKTQTTDMGPPREPDPIVPKSSVFFGTNASRVTDVQFDEEWFRRCVRLRRKPRWQWKAPPQADLERTARRVLNKAMLMRFYQTFTSRSKAMPKRCCTSAMMLLDKWRMSLPWAPP